METLIQAFRRQNDALTEHLTLRQLVSLNPYAEHHSGGLLVAGKDVDDGSRIFIDGSRIYCKMHDTWGDPDDPNEGPIVVHIYDTEADSIPATDVCLYFRNGSDAVGLFLNDEALVAIWKATR